MILPRLSSRQSPPSLTPALLKALPGAGVLVAATSFLTAICMSSFAVAQSFDVGEAVAHSATVAATNETTATADQSNTPDSVDATVEESAPNATSSISPLTSSSLSLLSDDTGLTPQVAEGVSGTRDKKRRNPVLTIQQVYRTDGGVKVLADAYVPNSEFADYPMQFDFYIDRRLFSSQFRSVELPGAVGIDIGPDVAVPPFNFTVVAKVVHPNSVYTSVAQGAFLPGQAPQTAATLACTLEEIESTDTGDSGEPIDSTSSKVFTNSAVKFTTSASSSTLTFSFTAESDSGESVTVTGSVTPSDTAAAGSLNLTQVDSSRAAALNGETSTSADGKLETIDLSNDDGSITLSCETTGDTAPTTAQPSTASDAEFQEDSNRGLKELEIFLG